MYVPVRGNLVFMLRPTRSDTVPPTESMTMSPVGFTSPPAARPYANTNITRNITIHTASRKCQYMAL